jgi:hypothetical protein
LIQEALGHGDMRTTTVYAHLSTGKRRQEITRLLEMGGVMARRRDDDDVDKRFEEQLLQLCDVRELCRAMGGGDLPEWLNDQFRVARALRYVDSHAASHLDSPLEGAVLRRQLRTWYRAHKPE